MLRHDLLGVSAAAFWPEWCMCEIPVQRGVCALQTVVAAQGAMCPCMGLEWGTGCCGMVVCVPLLLRSGLSGACVRFLCWGVSVLCTRSLLPRVPCVPAWALHGGSGCCGMIFCVPPLLHSGLSNACVGFFHQWVPLLCTRSLLPMVPCVPAWASHGGSGWCGMVICVPLLLHSGLDGVRVRFLC